MAAHPEPPGEPHDMWLPEVAAYAMDALTPAEAAAVREHLDDCPECRRELALFRELIAELGKVAKEAFLDGPPENAEFLIRGTLRRIRAENELAASAGPKSGARFRYRELAVAAAAVVLAVTAGAVIGRSSAPTSGIAVADPPIPSVSATFIPGTRQATSVDSKSGARLTTQIIPAQGWVRVVAATAGIKQGQKCSLYVVSRNGQRVMAGSWLVSEVGDQQGTTLQGSALTAPEDVAAVEVENSEGVVLVRTQV